MSVHNLRIFSQNDRSTNRSFGHVNSESHSPTIVDWRTYDVITLEQMSRDDLENRIWMLVNMLKSARPGCFRVLECLGYFEDNTGPRFGLVFQYPHDPDPIYPLQPLTLHQIMNRAENIPSLEERFGLAHFLAGCLHEFLCADWLHKSIDSYNLLFFQRSDGRSGRVSLQDPYFAGFALARPDGTNIQT
ncbi:uncharacterized protein A1O9_06913 [Exophiala aquamarina CBS 119918]|uniref:Protein kinase domain-containing protein n=1 Tax=Exophiala aquamarina CBS 119918 TaxID=1182545 RepID=A0A072PBT0_9EURO|nr:uncharacterized protein A1O9_06913 [Exophiala aquamarina CBS 119918]KEF56723.1 hypothetical protein A1O9_06913 [Exophiala aquamarina CBS 119918]